MKHISISLATLILAVILTSFGCLRDKIPAPDAAIPPGTPIPSSIVNDLQARHHVPGVSIAVVHQGRIDWAKGYGVLESGMTAAVDTNTLFQAASISKPVSAFAALRMVDKKQLSLDEDVNLKLISWKVPANQFTARRPVTLRGILSHSAGLPMHGVPEFDSDQNPATLVQILDGTWPGAKDSVRPVIEPGKEFRYSGGGYIILQLLMTDVSKRPFGELVADLVLKPAGMSSSTYEQPPPRSLWPRAAVGHTSNGTPLHGKWHVLPELAAGGLWTTPRDLASFMIENWRSYHDKPNALLPQPLAREMLTRQIGEYGLGLSLPNWGVPRFQHSGGNDGYRCHMVLSIEVPDGFVIMTNGDSGEELIWDIFTILARSYNWAH
jgi:CubicO group peptidase (beta-lactamase class C family)